MASYRTPLRFPFPPLYPYLLPRPMAPCRGSPSVYNSWKRSHFLRPHVPLIAVSPTRKVPRTSNRQNVEILGSICLRQGRPA